MTNIFRVLLVVSGVRTWQFLLIYRTIHADIAWCVGGLVGPKNKNMLTKYSNGLFSNILSKLHWTLVCWILNLLPWLALVLLWALSLPSTLFMAIVCNQPLPLHSACTLKECHECFCLNFLERFGYKILSFLS